MRTGQPNNNSKLIKIISYFFMVITVLTCIGASIMTVRLKGNFLELYKELKDYNDLPSITKFLLSTAGSLYLSIFFISVAIFMIIKESRISRKKVTLIINIIVLIVAIILFFIYAGGVMFPILDFQA